jgi:hypothetical protein
LRLLGVLICRGNDFVVIINVVSFVIQIITVAVVGRLSEASDDPACDGGSGRPLPPVVSMVVPAPAICRMSSPVAGSIARQVAVIRRTVARRTVTRWSGSGWAIAWRTCARWSVSRSVPGSGKSVGRQVYWSVPDIVPDVGPVTDIDVDVIADVIPTTGTVAGGSGAGATTRRSASRSLAG